MWPARRLLVAVALAGTLGACNEPPPRTFAEFMEDEIAREGVLARCDLEPEASQNDIECANARRAAATIALSEERARREALERESEQKLKALREQIRRREEAEREAVAAAARAAQEAYEAQWEGDGAGTIPPPAVEPGAVSVAAPTGTQAVTQGAPSAAPAGSSETQPAVRSVEARPDGAPLQEIPPPTHRRLERAASN